MIQRESYMSRIRPFINSDLIKVLTGIRRSGKSVMLELIQEELLANGIHADQILSYNFENMRFMCLCTAQALYQEIIERTSGMNKKAYLFFDEIQEVADWEKCVNSFRVELNCDIYITGSNAKLLSGELATYLAGRYVEFVIYPWKLCSITSNIVWMPSCSIALSARSCKGKPSWRPTRNIISRITASGKPSLAGICGISTSFWRTSFSWSCFDGATP